MMLDGLGIGWGGVMAAVGACFFAAFIKGATGQGFITTAIGVLALAIGLKAALPLLLIPSLSSNVLVMRGAASVRATGRRFLWLYVGAVIGVSLGLWALARVDGRAAGGALGGVLIGYALFALGRPQLQISPGWERPLQPVVGLATGAVNGLTGSQVMPILPYLLALRLKPDEFVTAINLSFTVSSLVMVVGLSRIGLLTWEIAAFSAALTAPVWAGVTLGARVRRRLSDEGFRKGVLLVLLAIGAGLIVKGMG